MAAGELDVAPAVAELVRTVDELRTEVSDRMDEVVRWKQEAEYYQTQAKKDADRARAAAMVSADGAALEAALHDELTYAHSTGSVDSKVQLIATLIAGEIDYLSIDTEGSEYEILAAFPFEDWDIRLITVEHNFTPMREDIRTLLERHGYVRQEDIWGVYPNESFD